MNDITPITVAKGDGIGPSIVDAALKIMEAAGAKISPEFVEMGEKVYLSGNSTGIDDKAWDSIKKTGILFKGPFTTPQGGGYKSVNVTLRKTLGLFSNVRPVKTYSPFVASKHSGVDMVIVRENEEDLYAGIEYRQTRDTCQSVKLISRSGTERLVRYAFEYARANGRKKVTCMIKDNIMKISDGLFHKVFKLIAKEYPEIEADSYIVDIGMAMVAACPERFDVLVTLNLYGDIVSDIASQVAGSVGLSGSMNIGEKFAMFEAIHGSAPDIAGKNIANPSGVLNGAILMLHHIGQSEVAVKIENAWLKTLEEGKHTVDISENKQNYLSTEEFADAVIANLGKSPEKLQKIDVSNFNKMIIPNHEKRTISTREKKLVGVDVFVDCRDVDDIQEFGKRFECLSVNGLEFKLISSRGMKVYPTNEKDIKIVTDLWRARFYSSTESMDNATIISLLEAVELAKLDWVKVENLYTYDGEEGFSLLQGE